MQIIVILIIVQIVIVMQKSKVVDEINILFNYKVKINKRIYKK